MPSYLGRGGESALITVRELSAKSPVALLIEMVAKTTSKKKLAQRRCPVL